jgi:HEPN domain-containing protein
MIIMSSNKEQRKKEIEIVNSFEYGKSLLEAARISLEEATSHKEKSQWVQVVHSSQQCIELSVKSITSFISGAVTPVHELDDETIMGVEARKPPELAYVNLTRLYIIQKLWATFYIESKYGKEKYGLGPEKLFTELEAEFAIKHAEIAKSEAWQVFDHYLRSTTKEP